MGVDPQCFLVLFGRLSVVVVVGVSRGEVEAQFRRIGPGGNSVPKEGNRVSIIARLCIRFRQGYLHFEREVWPGRMTQTILEIIDGGLVFFLRAQQAGKAIRGQGKARINRQRFLEFVAGLLEPGQPATLEVIGSAANSQRWFGVYLVSPPAAQAAR